MSSHVFTSQLLFQASKSWTVSLNCWVRYWMGSLHFLPALVAVVIPSQELPAVQGAGSFNCSFLRNHTVGEPRRHAQQKSSTCEAWLMFMNSSPSGDHDTCIVLRGCGLAFGNPGLCWCTVFGIFIFMHPWSNAVSYIFLACPPTQMHYLIFWERKCLPPGILSIWRQATQ